jgi:hypothetical protein
VLGIRDYGSRIRVKGLSGSGLGFSVWGLGFRIQELR